MAVRRKPDYSRMVMLDMSPTEAANIEAVLMAMLSIDLETRCLDEGQRSLVCGVIDRLDRQLKLLYWPASNHAPYPV